MKRQKDNSIETLRGIAIILMVAGHVIGVDSKCGMQVEDHSVYRYLYYSLMFLRMPLFTVISGYVYALRPVIAKDEFNFLKGKARRVLLPMIFVGTFHLIIQNIIPGTNAKTDLINLWRIYFFPYAHFWFLQALFLVFITVTILERSGFLSKINNWLITILISVLFFINGPYTFNFFSFSSFSYLLPFFILGVGINRFEDRFKNKVIVRFLLFIFICSLSLQQFNWYGLVSFELQRHSLVSLIIGLSGTSLLFVYRKNIRLLAFLGSFGYSIYLFHVFGTAGIRIIMYRLNLGHYEFQIFLASLAFGLIIPVIIELTFNRINILRMLFLGLKSKTFGNKTKPFMNKIVSSN